MTLTLASAEELEILREWLRKIPYVDLAMCDDRFLQHYYVHRHGSLQDTKETIHNFFKSFLVMSKKLTLMDPARKDANTFYRSAYDFLSPKLTEDGSFINYHTVRLPIQENYGREAIIMMRRRIILKSLMYPPTVNKMIVIYDFENYSLEVMSHWDLLVLRQFLNSGLKSIPFRLTVIHAINISAVAKVAMQLITSLISEKYALRIVCHSNLESLHKCVPKEVLPSDLGGRLGTREELTAQYRQLELKYREDLLKWQESFEGLHGKFEDIIGKVDTSTFRKLEVD